MGPYASFGMEAKFYAMIEVFWNQITLLLAMVGIAFLIASKRGARAMDMVLFVNALYLGIALIFMVIGLAFLPSLFVLPQWILFLFMAALGQIGWHIQKGRGALAPTTHEGSRENLEAHAIRVVGGGRRPVREHADNANVFRQHIKQFKSDAIIVGHISDGLEIPAAAIGQGPRALQCPGDDVQPGGFGLFGVN